MRRTLLLGLAPALLAGAAAATVVLRLDLEGLATRSDAIFEGKVLGTRPVLDGGGRIATEVRVSVERAWKGTPAQTETTFRIPGGEMGGLGFVIPGMPGFAAGEEVLLFLSEESWSGIRVPVGLGQGKFRVERDAAGAKRLVRSLGGVELADPVTGETLAGPDGERFDYEALVAAIARLAGK